MCFVCSKELSHKEGSFEYPQHMFWFRNKKNNFQLCTLIWGAGVILFRTQDVMQIWSIPLNMESKNSKGKFLVKY